MRYILSVLLLAHISAVATNETQYAKSKQGTHIFVKTSNSNTKQMTCYDQDRLYKHCADQNLLLEQARTEAIVRNKDLLLIYGSDSCCWCRSIVNLLHFSDIQHEMQDKFVIRTIARSNATGREVINNLHVDNTNFFYRNIIPYLIRVEAKTGRVKDLIHTDELKPTLEYGWCSYNLEVVTQRLLNGSRER